MHMREERALKIRESARVLLPRRLRLHAGVFGMSSQGENRVRENLQVSSGYVDRAV